MIAVLSERFHLSIELCRRMNDNFRVLILRRKDRGDLAALEEMKKRQW